MPMRYSLSSDLRLHVAAWFNGCTSSIAPSTGHTSTQHPQNQHSSGYVTTGSCPQVKQRLASFLTSASSNPSAISLKVFFLFSALSDGITVRSTSSTSANSFLSIMLIPGSSSKGFSTESNAFPLRKELMLLATLRPVADAFTTEDGLLTTSPHA